MHSRHGLGWTQVRTQDATTQPPLRTCLRPIQTRNDHAAGSSSLSPLHASSPNTRLAKFAVAISLGLWVMILRCATVGPWPGFCFSLQHQSNLGGYILDDEVQLSTGRPRSLGGNEKVLGTKRLKRGEERGLQFYIASVASHSLYRAAACAANLIIMQLAISSTDLALVVFSRRGQSGRCAKKDRG